MDKTVNTIQISVLMPVYNGERFLREAIDSVLSQSFTLFELILLNDGSTDESENIILSYKDERIVYVKNERNLGLIAILNKGIELCKGKYIARMDADDISLPDRFKRQIEFMESNPNCAVLGTNYINFSDSFEVKLVGPETSDEIKTHLLFSCCVCHPSVLIKKESLMQLDVFYNKDYKYVEDYELWTRLIENSTIYNLQVPLLKYRHHTAQVSNANRIGQISTSNKLRANYLTSSGFGYTDEQLEAHNLIGSNEKLTNKNQLQQVNNWLLNLLEQNAKLHFANHEVFKKVISKYWIDTCGNTSLGLTAYRFFNKSELSNLTVISFGQRFKLFAKCIIRFFRK
jgi:glycosyltransferase involved in cell wall biosynthesis